MGTLWVYIARKMRMLDFSTLAIKETLALLGFLKSESAIQRALYFKSHIGREVPDGYEDWLLEVEPYVSNYHDTLLTPAQVRYLLKDETAGGSVAAAFFLKNCYIVEGKNVFDPEYRVDNGSSDEYQNYEVGLAESEVLHSEDPSHDSFSFWSDDKYKSGLQRYLDYEKRSNDEESRIDYDAL